MFRHLQIYDPRERWLVGTVDALLDVPLSYARVFRPLRSGPWPPRRILLLRLERIGDLLMSAPAIAAIRAQAPEARIDLVVGSWNASLAALIPGIDHIETLDAPWLSRSAPARGSESHPLRQGGPAAAQSNAAAGSSNVALMKRALSWRARKYDLAINFEGDIRSNGLMMLSGARRRIGFDMAGGGPMLTSRVPFSPERHTTANAWRLVWQVFPTATAGDEAFRLAVPAEARARAAGMLSAAGGAGRPVIAVHASGGRAIKQWPVSRFAEVAGRLALEQHALLLLTGAPGDRTIVDQLRAALPASVDVMDLVGEVELPLLAAMLERCRLLVTGDTGPMHLAAFVGTPIVAVFGPSDPVRYAPLASPHRVVRIDLPCAPCNRIRLPPARCQGHTPDCLEGVTVDAVYAAARGLLATTRSPS